MNSENNKQPSTAQNQPQQGAAKDQQNKQQGQQRADDNKSSRTGSTEAGNKDKGAE